MGDRLLHGVAGDLAELDAVDWLAAWDAGRLSDMPGDRLALAVGVGRQVDRIGRLDRLLERGDDLLFALGHLVDRYEPAVDIDAEIAFRQVAHVAHRGLDTKTAPQIFLNR